MSSSLMTAATVFLPLKPSHAAERAGRLWGSAAGLFGDGTGNDGVIFFQAFGHLGVNAVRDSGLDLNWLRLVVFEDINSPSRAMLAPGTSTVRTGRTWASASGPGRRIGDRLGWPEP